MCGRLCIVYRVFYDDALHSVVRNKLFCNFCIVAFYEERTRLDCGRAIGVCTRRGRVFPVEVRTFEGGGFWWSRTPCTAGDLEAALLSACP